MKLTQENEKILLKLGFKPDKEKIWWQHNGWWFRIDAISGFKKLIEKMMKIEYARGVEYGMRRE